MNDVIIVVPIYKTEFDEFEIVSLTQLFKVLNNYPIVFVMPDGLELDISKSVKTDCQITYEYFDKNYFTSKNAYSRLCLSIELYNRFSEYEYMLIYQTDAFVFSDRLMEFVRAGFDYIGAPQDNDGFKEFHVGNGGLSLRNISKAIEILEKKEQILEQLPIEISKHYIDCEDNFWGYCGYNTNIDFNVPSVEKAAEFSLMGNIMDLYKYMLQKDLPFGLHAWSYCDYSFWKPVIESHGYNLPDVEEVVFDDQCWANYYNKMHEWWNQVSEKDISAIMDETHLSRDIEYVIWGYGKYGKKILNVFQKLGLHVNKIMDSSVSKDEYVSGEIVLVSPTEKDIKSSEYIVVAIKGMYENLKKDINRLNPNITVIKIEDLIDGINTAFKAAYPEQDYEYIKKRILNNVQ